MVRSSGADAVLYLYSCALICFFLFCFFEAGSPSQAALEAWSMLPGAALLL